MSGFFIFGVIAFMFAACCNLVGLHRALAEHGEQLQKHIDGMREQNDAMEIALRNSLRKRGIEP